MIKINSSENGYVARLQVHKHIMHFEASTEKEVIAQANGYFTRNVLPELQRRTQKTLIEQAEQAIKGFVFKYDFFEQLSWSEQVHMARAYVAGTASEDESTNLETMASLRGLADASEMANKIIAKATSFRTISTHITSLKNKAFEDVQDATTSEGVDTIVSEFNNNLENLIKLFKGEQK